MILFTLPFTIRVLPLKKLLKRSSSLNEHYHATCIAIIATSTMRCVSTLPLLPLLPSLPSATAWPVYHLFRPCHHCHDYHHCHKHDLCIIITTIVTIAMIAIRMTCVWPPASGSPASQLAHWPQSGEQWYDYDHYDQWSLWSLWFDVMLWSLWWDKLSPHHLCPHFPSVRRLLHHVSQLKHFLFFIAHLTNFDWKLSNISCRIQWTQKIIVNPHQLLKEINPINPMQKNVNFHQLLKENFPALLVQKPHPLIRVVVVLPEL